MQNAVNPKTQVTTARGSENHNLGPQKSTIKPLWKIKRSNPVHFGGSRSLNRSDRIVLRSTRELPHAVVPSLAGGDGVDSATVSFLLQASLKKKEEEEKEKEDPERTGKALKENQAAGAQAGAQRVPDALPSAGEEEEARGGRSCRKPPPLACVFLLALLTLGNLDIISVTLGPALCLVLGVAWGVRDIAWFVSRYVRHLEQFHTFFVNVVLALLAHGKPDISSSCPLLLAVSRPGAHAPLHGGKWNNSKQFQHEGSFCCLTSAGSSCCLRSSSAFWAPPISTRQ